MAEYSLSQANRALRTTQSPVGPDELLPISYEGEEAISRPFRFVVDFVSENRAVSASSLLGQPMGLVAALPGGGSRHIHGVVRRFTHLGTTAVFARYRAELVPQLWFLGLSADCRTFEEMSIPGVVQQVCNDGGVKEFQQRIMGAYDPDKFIVQYRESNLAFVSRLLESAGLYYFFEHAANKHTMVISDNYGGSVPAGTLASVRVGLGSPGSRPGIDTVTELAREYSVHTSKVQLLDHALLRPDNAGNAQSSHPGARGTFFDFLGDLGPNASLVEAKRGIEREEAGYDQFVGRSTCASFTAGTRVKLTGGITGAAGAEVHLLEVRHRFSQGDIMAGGGETASYENEFRAIDAAARFRPQEATAWPSVQGTQTAKIVGTGGAGEIDIDADGRVLLQFPWDQGAGKAGKSKHRVHVASAWAGTGWGFVQHPRIGQEVLVEFLEGDPNRPIVTGRVYNSSNKFPYALPANKTQSGWKSRTLGGGDANFNELRFEDKKGEEHVYLQAERNLRTLVKVDEVRDVGNDRKTSIGHDEYLYVKHRYDVDVDEGNHYFTMNQGDHQVEVKEGQMTVMVKKDFITTVSEGNFSTTVAEKNIHLTASEGNIKLAASQKDIQGKAGAKMSLEAGDELTLKCGAASIAMKKDGTITIKGVQITIEGSAKVQIKGAQVAAEGQAQTEIKGAMLKLEGQAMTTLKGAIAQITGDGMLKAGGGISMFG